LSGKSGQISGLHQINVFIGQSKFHILFLFFVSSMFSISLCSLLCYHIHLVLHNRTTLEAFRAPVFRYSTTVFIKLAHLPLTWNEMF
jgi:hypothetical protein